MSLTTIDWTGKGRPSRKVLEGCSAFGLALARRDRSVPANTAARENAFAALAEEIAREALRKDPANQDRGCAPILLLGPSGCGKSTLLRAFARRAREAGQRVIRPIDPAHLAASGSGGLALIDQLPGTLAGTIRALARAGLADAALLPRRACELSEGERARLSLAMAMRRIDAAERMRPAAKTLSPSEQRGREPCPRRVLLLIDEFTSVLDRVTARGVALSLARFMTRHPRVQLICASPHEDLAAWWPQALIARGSLGHPPPRAASRKRSASPVTDRADPACITTPSQASPITRTIQGAAGTWTITTPSSARERGPTTSRSRGSTTARGTPRRTSASSPRTTPPPGSSRASSSSRCPR